MKIEILSEMETDRLGDQLWVIMQLFRFKEGDFIHEVPQGFVFDGNSVPRLLWPVCAPIGGIYGEAGLPHDYFYSKDCKEAISRKKADQIHQAIGLLHGAGSFRANLVYSGLRLFGKGSFRKKYSIEKLTEQTCYNLVEAKKKVISLRTNKGDKLG